MDPVDLVNAVQILVVSTQDRSHNAKLSSRPLAPITLEISDFVRSVFVE